METESEEREACLRRHRERDGARWASPTVDQTQARLEHNASYRHTHLQQLATNCQRRLESEMAEESYTRFFFSAISIFLPYIRSCNVCQPCAMDLSATDSSAMAWRSTQQRRIAAESTEEICQPLIRPPWHGGALSNGGSLPSQQRRERLVFIN